MNDAATVFAEPVAVEQRGCRFPPKPSVAVLRLLIGEVLASRATATALRLAGMGEGGGVTQAARQMLLEPQP